MAKTITPLKVFIFFTPEGDPGSAIIQYKVANDGVFQQRLSSLTVTDSLDSGKVEDILTAALNAAKTAEGIE